MSATVQRAEPSAPLCSSPNCSACGAGRGTLHRYRDDAHTACGLRLRLPTDAPAVDREGRPIKPQPISYTCRDEWTTCPDCLVVMA